MNLDRATVHRLQASYDLIREHYGESKYSYDLPDLVLYYDENDSVAGEYDDNLHEISLNLFYSNSIEECVKTMVHEYQHYLQPTGWYQRYYDMGHTHQTHPYEIEAEEIAERDYQLFMQPFTSARPTPEIDVKFEFIAPDWPISNGRR